MRSTFLLFVLFLCCFDDGESWRRRRRRSPPPPPRINGGWSGWGGYGGCSRTCGGGLMYRHRSCTNPTPRNGGAGCPGSSSQQASCNARACPVWSGWGAYGACGKTCGGGVRTRHRSCTHAINGGGCPGASSNQAACNAHKCSVLPVGNPIPFSDGGKFQLQGCFKDYTQHMKELIITERDHTHHAWNRKWLNWNDWNKFMTEFISRCAVKAKAKGYQAFGMAYYGECWADKAMSDTLAVYTDNLRNTSMCTKEHFADCKTGSAKCIGKEWGIAVYQLIQD